MSVLLHISDLHLGKGQPWERKTDDKGGFVPQDENSRLAVMKTSLTAVKEHLDASGWELDALVVSGDITTAHDEPGFTRFRELVDTIGIVTPDRIIAVPGNHDVDRASDPGTPGKYELFLKHTREQDMRTPFCDGVDKLDDANAQPILDLEDCLVAAVNSANWCGVKVESTGTDHRYDAARVSETQLDWLTDQLRDHEADGKVRLAVLHHHLLPVTEDEETKPYESFTNLARLRAWLSHHRFHGVLHGHKHRSVLTWDHVHAFEDHEAPATPILVVSAPTPTTWGAPVCRIVRIGEQTGRELVRHAPRLEIDTVDAERKERLIIPRTAAVNLHEPITAPPGFVAIDCETADAAYERLVAQLDRRPGRLLNVTCVVRQPESAERIPTNFAGKLDDPEGWFKDAVKWWQKRSPSLVAHGGAPFNHGERLLATGVRESELDEAGALLGSTKAVVFLTSNRELRSVNQSPAFIAVQLVKATDAEGDRLDCIGYFRKQDLTLWWPVNVGELRAIQKHVLDRGTDGPVRAGHLVTIATEAIHDFVMPELSGTKVDRFVDLRPEVLMEMAYGAAHGPADRSDPEARDKIHALWAQTFSDIGKVTEDDVKEFPSLGVARLLEHLRVFREVGARSNVELLIKRLEAVYDRAHRAKSTSKTATERKEFARELFGLIGGVLEAVETSMSELE
ncbi:MAG TPA: metallophosphoesterase [Solirubrobacteraceae bacterium]|jgi:3',5'-cyclic AMP phosphodiesterase CpdA